MSTQHPANSLQFIDISFPPQIAVVNMYWVQSISNNATLRQLFDGDLIKKLSQGYPQPADEVLQLLSHWIKEQNDIMKIRQTYAMRLRLEAFMYQHVIHRTSIDRYSWRLLGVCSIGRNIAIRLNANLKLDETTPWTNTMLWDWRTLGQGGDEKVACTIGMDKPELELQFPLASLQKSVFLIFVATGAYLWPSAYPIMDLGISAASQLAG